MTEVVKDVHRIEAQVGGRPLYLFVFLGERRLLLDAGCASTVEDFIAPSFERLGLALADLDLLLITHPDLDHQGGAHRLRQEKPPLWIGSGALDMPLVSDPARLISDRYHAYAAEHGLRPDTDVVGWMRQESGEPERIDIGFAGGEVIELGAGWNLRVLRVPGHSPGHLAVFDERCRALFSGDCLQGSVYLDLEGKPKLCPTYTDVDQYLATAASIEALAPSELHGAHWPAMRGPDVFSFIDESRNYVRHVDELVRASFDSSPLTLEALITRVNQRLVPSWPQHIAGELVYSLHGHAEWLVARGLATRERDGRGRTVYAVAS